jgi:hypothetical protein
VRAEDERQMGHKKAQKAQKKTEDGKQKAIDINKNKTSK